MHVAALLMAQAGAVNSSAQTEANGLTQAQDWSENESKSVFLAFNSWAARFTEEADEGTKAGILSQGIALAKHRRAAFTKLIKNDPAQALYSSVPASVRQRLPAEIADELETRVSGIGDFSVRVIDALPGQTVAEPIQRFVRLNGQTYRAHVYGRRDGETTKYGIPMHGVAMDGVLALHESALREPELGEKANGPILTVDPRTDAEQLLGHSMPVLAEIDGKIYRFASREQLWQADARLKDAEAGIGPKPVRSADAAIKDRTQPQTKSITPSFASSPSWTTGNKKALIIRVDFSDDSGNPNGQTAADVQNIADSEVSPFFQRSSYGKTSISFTVTSELYRMPESKRPYATNIDGPDQLLRDAKAAVARDYNLMDYDRIIVLYRSGNVYAMLGDAWYLGNFADLGGENVWLDGFNAATVVHELGHTYGLYHANLWQVSDFNPISDTGFSKPYGDPFDPMSNQAYLPVADFNPFYKSIMRWIPATQVEEITSSGVYRVNPFDDSTGTGTLALKIVKDNTRNYWIGVQRARLSHGAYVRFGYNSLQGRGVLDQHFTDLLDMTTPGSDSTDAALAMGTTFTDVASNVSIRPVAEGGTRPNEFLDVQVIFGPVPPAIVTQPSSQITLPGLSAQFLVRAGGIPAPSHQWQRKAVGSPLWSNLSDDGTYEGSGTATLTLENATVAMNGDGLRCVVSNSQGSTTSSVAVLTVNATGVATLAGHTGIQGSEDGPSPSARFMFPSGIAVDSIGNVYVTDCWNHTIRKITSAGLVTTLAGKAHYSGSADGIGSNARFTFPSYIAVDSTGNVYVVDTGNCTIRKVTPAGLVTTLAGKVGNSGSADGIGSNARFDNLGGVAVDSSGNVYATELGNHTIREITSSGSVTTIAGQAGSRGDADGTTTNARFDGPWGIAVDNADNLYVADFSNKAIRKITSAGVVSKLAILEGGAHSVSFDTVRNGVVVLTGNAIWTVTLAGAVNILAGHQYQPGSVDGTANDARFYGPGGVAVDSAGSVYVADSYNYTIRKGLFPIGTILKVSANVQEIIISWSDPAGTLEEANNVTGPWRSVSGESISLRSLPMSTSRKFYRLRK